MPPGCRLASRSSRRRIAEVSQAHPNLSRTQLAQRELAFASLSVWVSASAGRQARNHVDRIGEARGSRQGHAVLSDDGLDPSQRFMAWVVSEIDAINPRWREAAEAYGIAGSMTAAAALLERSDRVFQKDLEGALAIILAAHRWYTAGPEGLRLS